MVARVRPQPAALIVTFSRDGEEPDTVFTRDGVHAWQQAIHLITKREWLLSGDTGPPGRSRRDRAERIRGSGPSPPRGMMLLARLSRALAIIRCVLFHRRHRVARVVGLFDCEVICRKCGRIWMAN